MKIKQITFNEALELAKNKEDVYVIKINGPKKTPTIRSFKTMIIGDMMNNQDNYIFCVIEEGLSK